MAHVKSGLLQSTNLYCTGTVAYQYAQQSNIQGPRGRHTVYDGPLKVWIPLLATCIPVATKDTKQRFRPHVTKHIFFGSRSPRPLKLSEGVPMTTITSGTDCTWIQICWNRICWLYTLNTRWLQHFLINFSKNYVTLEVFFVQYLCTCLGWYTWASTNPPVKQWINNTSTMDTWDSMSEL